MSVIITQESYFLGTLSLQYGRGMSEVESFVEFVCFVFFYPILNKVRTQSPSVLFASVFHGFLMMTKEAQFSK